MRLFPAFLLAVCLPVGAQTRPANLEPLPEPPPPPPGMIEDNATEPQVTIKRRGEDRVEEYRMNGKLYMLKVTPARHPLLSGRSEGRWRLRARGSGRRRPRHFRADVGY